jgi:hypothetical protein
MEWNLEEKRGVGRGIYRGGSGEVGGSAAVPVRGFAQLARLRLRCAAPSGLARLRGTEFRIWCWLGDVVAFSTVR